MTYDDKKKGNQKQPKGELNTLKKLHLKVSRVQCFVRNQLSKSVPCSHLQLNIKNENAFFDFICSRLLKDDLSVNYYGPNIIKTAKCLNDSSQLKFLSYAGLSVGYFGYYLFYF